MKLSYIKVIILLFGLVPIMFGCQQDQYYYAEFPSVATNFSILNTSYNDYNSNIGPGRRLQITFSSDRNGEGHYDFVVERVDMEYLTSEGYLYMERVTNDVKTIMSTIIDEVNTSANEFGPHASSDGENLYMLYANDESGNLDIKYALCEGVTSEQVYFQNHEVSEVSSIGRINTEHNEAYPCVYNNNMYYCTDEKGTYNIAYTYLDYPFREWLDIEDSVAMMYPENVNSDADDKCPFVLENIMVFTSNREGGYGGFDLYFCLQDEFGVWSEPVNFGPDINSSADEYRPVVAYFGDFENDLMIFSSNREGGQGGFDLYYVGFEKLINLQ